MVCQCLRLSRIRILVSAAVETYAVDQEQESRAGFGDRRKGITEGVDIGDESRIGVSREGLFFRRDFVFSREGNKQDALLRILAVKG